MDQERLTNQDMESLGEELLREKQSMEREMHTLRAEKDRQVLTHNKLHSTVLDFRAEALTSKLFVDALFSPASSNQILELESERQHLSDAVASLHERAQSNSEERVREVEAENRQLHQNLTDAGSRLASLETQLKLANEEAKSLREKAGRCEEAEREAMRLERSRDALNREVILLQLNPLGSGFPQFSFK